VMHLAFKEIAMFAWLPFLAAVFGCVAGGFLAKFFMVMMHMTTINARRCSFTMGGVLMISMGFVSITTNP
ncbi:MFS transporter, partial [Salmonella enterica]